jgi:hypothetical protein
MPAARARAVRRGARETRDRGFTTSRSSFGRASPMVSDQKDHELRADVARGSWRGPPPLVERSIDPSGRRSVDPACEPESGDNGHAARGRDTGPRRLLRLRHCRQGHDLAAVRMVLAQHPQRALAAAVFRGFGARVERQEAERLAVEVPAARLHDPKKNGEREDQAGRRRYRAPHAPAIRRSVLRSEAHALRELSLAIIRRKTAQSQGQRPGGA